jgi:hypothetical protein
MKTKSTRLTGLLGLACLVSSFAVGQDSAKPKQDPPKTVDAAAIVHLSGVHKIFVAELNRSEHAADFRLLLSDKLKARGFAVVETAVESDATLIGNLTVDEDEGKNLVRVSAMMFNSLAKELWEGKAGEHQTGAIQQRLDGAADELLEKFSVAWHKDDKKHSGK